MYGGSTIVVMIITVENGIRKLNKILDRALCD